MLWFACLAFVHCAASGAVESAAGDATCALQHQQKQLFPPFQLYAQMRHELSYMDTDTEARKDLSLWRPKLKAGQYYLGDSCSRHHFDEGDQPMMLSIVIEPNYGFEWVVSQPTGMTFLWNDRGTDGDEDGGFFMPECPPKYVALGIVGEQGLPNDLKDPGPVNWQDLRCIHEDFTMTTSSAFPSRKKIENDKSGKLLWNDKGSGAKYSGSIYLGMEYIQEESLQLMVRGPCVGYGPKGYPHGQWLQDIKEKDYTKFQPWNFLSWTALKNAGGFTPDTESWVLAQMNRLTHDLNAAIAKAMPKEIDTKTPPSKGHTTVVECTLHYAFELSPLEKPKVEIEHFVDVASDRSLFSIGMHGSFDLKVQARFKLKATDKLCLLWSGKANEPVETKVSLRVTPTISVSIQVCELGVRLKVDSFALNLGDVHLSGIKVHLDLPDPIMDVVDAFIENSRVDTEHAIKKAANGLNGLVTDAINKELKCMSLLGTW